jgi:gliding motility-associated-like protein
MTADPAVSGGSGKWSVVDGSGSFQNDSDNKTSVTGLSKGLNTFSWTVTRGACKVEDMIEVTVNDIFIPEGFSPNNDRDGYNNIFEIQGLDLENQTAELIIINGAGTEVFRTSNRNGDEWQIWDGKNMKGRDLPEGTYYYLLKITSRRNSAAFKKSGFVILKRY